MTDSVTNPGTTAIRAAGEAARLWRAEYLRGWTAGARDFNAKTVDRGQMVGWAIGPYTMGYRAARRAARGE